MDEKEMRAEKIGMVKHFYKEFEYRHKLVWNLIFKTIYAAIAVFVLPYFLALADSFLTLLWLFPVFGIALMYLFLFAIKLRGCTPGRMSQTDKRHIVFNFR